MTKKISILFFTFMMLVAFTIATICHADDKNLKFNRKTLDIVITNNNMILNTNINLAGFYQVSKGILLLNYRIDEETTKKIFILGNKNIEGVRAYNSNSIMIIEKFRVNNDIWDISDFKNYLLGNSKSKIEFLSLSLLFPETINSGKYDKLQYQFKSIISNTKDNETEITYDLSQVLLSLDNNNVRSVNNLNFPLESALLFITNNIYCLMHFELNAEYNPESIKGNFDRLLSKETCSFIDPVTKKEYKDRYFMEFNNRNIIFYIMVYPYRNKSKVIVTAFAPLIGKVYADYKTTIIYVGDNYFNSIKSDLMKIISD